jgi:outer membrane lipoprotein-sorting protein
MKFLRTVSTRRLLAVIAGLTAAAAAGTAIAVAAGGGGPVPPREPLARAIHQALTAQPVDGITARISFTNHLIDATNIQGSDPILQGASGRLWLSLTPGHRQLRVELQGDSGDAQLVAGNGRWWVYDPTSNTAYEGTLGGHDRASQNARRSRGSVPSIADIQQRLNHAMQHATLSGAIPGDIAGRPAYTLRVSPKHDGGLLGAGELAWDATRGIPLRLAIYARGDSTPVIEMKATDISFGPVPASDFSISPPSGAKIVKVTTPTHATHSAKGMHGNRTAIRGAAAVAKQLPFTLDAPKTLVGLPRRAVNLLSWDGHKAAVVTYGLNLGGVAVIETPAGSPGSAAGRSASSSGSGSGPASGSRSGDHGGLNLPTVSINGATGQELDTALGTMVRFTRGGVSYIVVGSVPPAAADLAARGL